VKGVMRALQLIGKEIPAEKASPMKIKQCR
jgi:hypothetical protein